MLTAVLSPLRYSICLTQLHFFTFPCFVAFIHLCFFKQDLTMYLRLALNSWASCLRPLNTGLQAWAATPDHTVQSGVAKPSLFCFHLFAPSLPIALLMLFSRLPHSLSRSELSAFCVSHVTWNSL